VQAQAFNIKKPKGEGLGFLKKYKKNTQYHWRLPLFSSPTA
jgi:hypothetical protein